ncbi:tripartite motif-containing 35-like protein [Labeo rohita]|uniref:Tripartite motif-containing 35-like protein n=1 Tax=Labeo rohita TaxID=84645 RepID=A0A498P308_LABRO|nr:tripartite motif-containing 35-like protein [Labeo rohita]RXN38593.1 tripartite motif-containing 35-like protein [Labeo rohita]
MTDFTAMLKNNFAGRLDGLDLPTELAVFVRDPFTVAIEGDFSARAKKLVPSIDEGKFTLELVDMQSSVTMAQELSTNGPAMFWTDVNAHQFPNIKKVAIVMLSMFGSTYTYQELNSETLIDIPKHLGNLKYQVWQKMKDMCPYYRVILNPNVAPPATSDISLLDDLTSVTFFFFFFSRNVGYADGVGHRTLRWETVNIGTLECVLDQRENLLHRF